MIENIYLTDNDENYAPPEQPLLEVGLVGDIAFLAIGKWTSGPDERSFTTGEGQQIAVCVTDLVNAVKILAISQERNDIVRAVGTDRDLRAGGV